VLPHDFLVGGNAGIAQRLKNPKERENLTYRILHTEAEGSLARAVGWENITLAALTREENKPFLGKTITEAAEMAKKDPFDFTYDLLISENCQVTMIDKITCDEDLERIIDAEFSNFISDSTYPTRGMFHPRVANAFVRTLEQYVKSGKFPLEKIIQKQTSMCAQVVNLHSKGQIVEGFDGDLVLFDLEKIHENATFPQPLLPPSGIEKVFVGGLLALDKGELTGNRGGKVLTA
jgi:N-acyl-D-amino-acid deacylase